MGDLDYQVSDHSLEELSDGSIEGIYRSANLYL